MPVSRGATFSAFITQQDNIANLTKDICGIILGRQMAIPKQLQGDFIGFADCSAETCRKAHGAINELDELLETGFCRVRSEVCAKADSRARRLRSRRLIRKNKSYVKKLFNIEADLSPIDVIFMYNIIEQIGGLADTAELIGNQVELLLAK